MPGKQSFHQLKETLPPMRHINWHCSLGKTSPAWFKSFCYRKVSGGCVSSPSISWLLWGSLSFLNTEDVFYSCPCCLLHTHADTRSFSRDKDQLWFMTVFRVLVVCGKGGFLSSKAASFYLVVKPCYKSVSGLKRRSFIVISVFRQNSLTNFLWCSPDIFVYQSTTISI